MLISGVEHSPGWRCLLSPDLGLFHVSPGGEDMWEAKAPLRLSPGLRLFGKKTALTAVISAVSQFLGELLYMALGSICQ